MQSDKEALGDSTLAHGKYVDTNIAGNAYVFYEDNYTHDDQPHAHLSYQLTFVAQGFQYIHIGANSYLVPPNHAIWIPSNLMHRTVSTGTATSLTVVLFKVVPNHAFYQQITVFAVPNVLKELLRYAAKWNHQLKVDDEQVAFLQAILLGLPNFSAAQNTLQIPVPADQRLKVVCDYINHHFKATDSLSFYAGLAHLSERSLQRIFKAETGITIKKYIQLIRVLKSVQLLSDRKFTLSQVAVMVGYQSLSAFTSAYKQIMQAKPKH